MAYADATTATSTAAYTFKAAPNAEPVTAPFVVTNVVPGDFDYDGRLDMLLMGQDSPAGWFSDDELKMVMHRGIGRGNFLPAVSVPSSHLQQPMLLDADGDMQVDMLGYPFSKDSKQQDLKLWRNAWQQSNGTELFSVCVHFTLRARIALIPWFQRCASDCNRRLRLQISKPSLQRFRGSRWRLLSGRANLIH